jgi:hypothetical protein
MNYKAMNYKAMNYKKSLFFNPDIIVAVAKQESSDYWQLQIANKEKALLVVLSQDELLDYHKLISEAVTEIIVDSAESDDESASESEPESEPEIRVFKPKRAHKHADVISQGVPDTKTILDCIRWLNDAYTKNVQVGYDTLANKLGISYLECRELLRQQQPWRDKIITTLSKIIAAR